MLPPPVVGPSSRVGDDETRYGYTVVARLAQSEYVDGRPRGWGEKQALKADGDGTFRLEKQLYCGTEKRSCALAFSPYTHGVVRLLPVDADLDLCDLSAGFQKGLSLLRDRLACYFNPGLLTP